MVDPTKDELLTTYEAAARVKCSERWLCRHSYTTEQERNDLLARGVTPIFRRYKLGKQNRYRLSEIQSSVLES